MNKMKYQKYLKSPWWQLTRANKLYISKYKCENCGSINRLQVHHKTYKNIGNEDMDDLKVLCEFCHKEIEHKEGLEKGYNELIADLAESKRFK